MLRFIVKELPMMIPMPLLISSIVYFGPQLTGIDPINSMVSPKMLPANEENVEALRESLELDDPLIIQYFRWLGNCLHGDPDYSFDSSSITSIIAVRLPYTFELAGYSLALSAVVGIGIGIISAIRQNSIIDYVGRVLAALGQAVPQFLIDIILIQMSAIKLGWFPSANRVSPDATNAFMDAFKHLFLPVLTLTIYMVAILMRYVRNTILNVLNSNYIKMVRSKSIPERKVYLKRSFRNAIKPVLVILAFRISILMGGSVVIESVFSYPDIGLTTADAIVSADYPTVLITTLIITAAVLICSFMVDVSNALLDPRVRLDEW